MSTPDPSKDYVHVAVGVIFNAARDILVSKRAVDSHMGGLWEFPGGKVERDESVIAALHRELREELGIRVTAQHPLKHIYHDYGDKAVHLDVWCVTGFTGEPRAREGQPLAWRPRQELVAADFPVANAPIVTLLGIPDAIPITPEVTDSAQLLPLMSHYRRSGQSLIQLRQPQLDLPTYCQWYEQLHRTLSGEGMQLIANHDPALLDQLVPDAYHARSSVLMSLSARPVPASTLFTASCHSLEELQQAERLGADLALLSPVQGTAKYTDEALLGWSGFAALADRVSLPVYALGGINAADLSRAWTHGAMGIAAISAFLPGAQG